MPLGSFSGGFSSTAGYVPGNEAHVPKNLSGVTPVLADHFQVGVVRFYPDNSDKLESESA